MATKLKAVKPKEETPVAEEVKTQEIEIPADIPESKRKPVSPGGPPQYLVDMWKEELRASGMDDQLIVAIIGGETSPFIYRKLMRPEYIEIINKTREGENDDYRDDVIDTCLLWPQGWTKDKRHGIGAKGGTFTTLFEHMMDNSGFNVVNTWTL
jgi:hypothetical protein